VGLLPLLGLSFPAVALCPTVDQATSIEEVVARVEIEGLQYIFVGERHGNGPVKRFAVDLANALMERNYDVGLYVEGFRTDCSPRDERCLCLASAFNRPAFLSLLEQSQAPVHPIDPPERDRRAARMAARIAEGPESIRIVLVGLSHVLYAGDPEGRVWTYGGAMQYPDPGDVAEAFPRDKCLLFGLETDKTAVAPYHLHQSGNGTDYLLVTRGTGDY